MYNDLQSFFDELATESADDLQHDNDILDAYSYAAESALADYGQAHALMTALQSSYDRHFGTYGTESFEAYQADVSLILMTAGVDIPVSVITGYSFEASDDAKDKVKEGVGKRIKEAWLRFWRWLKSFLKKKEEVSDKAVSDVEKEAAVAESHLKDLAETPENIKKIAGGNKIKIKVEKRFLKNGKITPTLLQDMMDLGNRSASVATEMIDAIITDDETKVETWIETKGRDLVDQVSAMIKKHGYPDLETLMELEEIELYPSEAIAGLKSIVSVWLKGLRENKGTVRALMAKVEKAQNTDTSEPGSMKSSVLSGIVSNFKITRKMDMDGLLGLRKLIREVKAA